MLSLVTPPLGRFVPSDFSDDTYVSADEQRPFAHCCSDCVVVVVELLLDPPHETRMTTTTTTTTTAATPRTTHPRFPTRFTSTHSHVERRRGSSHRGDAGDAVVAGPVTRPAYDPPGPMTVDSEITHRFGWRVERRRASRSFGVVLGLIIASFVFAASAPDSAWSTSVLVLLQNLTLIAALWTSGLAR